MVIGFPLPRAQLPKIEVTPQEHAAAKNMMERMLLHTVREFEQYTYEDKGVVDNKRWKSMASKDQLRVYKERQTGALSASLAFALEDTSGLPVGSTIAALTPASMMMTGTCPGRVENAMHAVVTKSQQELAMVVIYLHEDVADCAILNTMEGPTLDNPYGFLGYKYFVRKSPTSSHLVKHRDNLYLEYTGITRTSTGEELGYHMMHSVDLPSFPDLTEMNSVTALSSLRYLYRQKTDNIVEIFCIGNMDISGMLTSIGPMSTFFVSEIMFGCTRLIDCAETKRLTEMIEKRREQVEVLQAKSKSNECTICKHKKKVFGASLLAECNICGNSVCSRCRTHKKVFISDGILGKFQKVHCCKTCVLVANAGHVQQRINTNRSYTYSDGPTRSMSSNGGSSVNGSSIPRVKAYSDVSSSASSSPRYRHAPTRLYNPQPSDASAERNSLMQPGQSPSSERELYAHQQKQQQQYASHRQQRSSSWHRQQHDLIPLVENSLLTSMQNDLIPLRPKSVSSDNTSLALVRHNASPYEKPSIVRTSSTSSISSTSSGNCRFTPTPTSGLSGPGWNYYASPATDGGMYSNSSYYTAPSMGAGSYTSSESISGGGNARGTYPFEQRNIFARMMQISKVAESTYNTTQQNAAYMAQQQISPNWR